MSNRPASMKSTVKIHAVGAATRNNIVASSDVARSDMSPARLNPTLRAIEVRANGYANAAIPPTCRANPPLRAEKSMSEATAPG